MYKQMLNLKQYVPHFRWTTHPASTSYIFFETPAASDQCFQSFQLVNPQEKVKQRQGKYPPHTITIPLEKSSQG